MNMSIIRTSIGLNWCLSMETMDRYQVRDRQMQIDVCTLGASLGRRFLVAVLTHMAGSGNALAEVACTVPLTHEWQMLAVVE